VPDEVEDRARDRCRERRTAGHHRTQLGKEFVGGRPLEEVAVRAGTDRFEHGRTVLKNGEDDDGHVREPFLDAARALATAEARQVEVHEDQVPPGVFAAIEDRIQLGQRGGGGLERADQLEILRVAEEHLETGAVAGVILNGHDADHTYTPGTGSERPGWRYRPAAAARPTRSCRRPRPSE